jgi:predicted RNA-binding protein with RPS1 domain
MLGDTGAEGMLRVGHLKPGAKVKVKVEAVDTVEGKIDLSLAGPVGTQPAGAQQAKTKGQWRVTSQKKRARRRG